MRQIQAKKGLTLGDAFPAVLTVALVAILMISVIYLFNQFGSTFTAGTTAANATTNFTTQFYNQIPLVGLVLTIVLIAIVIGVLVTSFFVRGGSRV
jgi:type II secretory pathway component PulF